MPFYFIKDSYSAQIEGGGLNLRIGYTCLGYAYPKWQNCYKDLPWWKRRLTASIGINYNSAQSGRWYRFRIDLLGFQLWYLTKGEMADNYTGFHIAFRGFSNWKLIY